MKTILFWKKSLEFLASKFRNKFRYGNFEKVEAISDKMYLICKLVGTVIAKNIIDNIWILFALFCSIYGKFLYQKLAKVDLNNVKYALVNLNYLWILMRKPEENFIHPYKIVNFQFYIF